MELNPFRRRVLTGAAAATLWAAAAGHTQATEAAPMQKDIKIGDVWIAAESFGDRENPAIILAMGATASMLVWPESFCRALAGRGYFVVRYDYRDTGRSTTYPPGAPGYDLADLVSDLMALADGFQLDQFHLVGMSLGGYIGQIASIEHPDRIKTLTLIGSEPLGGADTELPGISDKFMQHFAAMNTLDWSDNAAIRSFMLGIAELSNGSAHPFDADAAGAQINAVINRAENMQSAFNHAMITADLAPNHKAANITAPVLVIHGSEDPVLPLQNGEAIARLTNADLLVLQGTGHELHADDLDEIVEAIASFLGKQ